MRRTIISLWNIYDFKKRLESSGCTSTIKLRTTSFENNLNYFLQFIPSSTVHYSTRLQSQVPTNVTLPKTITDLRKLNHEQVLEMLKKFIFKEALYIDGIAAIEKPRDPITNRYPLHALNGFHLYESIEEYNTNLHRGKNIAKQQMIESIMYDQKVTSKSVAKSIADWVCKFYIGEDSLVMQHRILYSTYPFSGETMKFVNRGGVVRKLAELLLQNKQYQRIPQRRSLQWIISSNYYGYGKTRLGLEFLNTFNKYLSKNDTYYRNDQFVKQMRDRYDSLVDELSCAQLLYIDLRDLGECFRESKTIDQLQLSFCSFIVRIIAAKLNINPHHLWQDYIENYSTDFAIGKLICNYIGECFLIIDEIQLIAEFAMTFTNEYDETLQRYKIAWKTLIIPLLIQQGISLYCCGKGAYLSIIGSGYFAEEEYLVSSIRPLFVNSFTKENIIDGMDSTSLITLKHYLLSKNLLDYFVEKLLDLTCGVADLCVIILNQASIEYTSLYDTTSVDEFLKNQKVEDKYNIVKKQKNHPFVNKVYEYLMLSSILELRIDLTQMIKVPKNSIYQGLDRVSLGDIATKFDCFIESVDDTSSYHRTVFPKIVLKEFQKEKIALIPSQMLLLNQAIIFDEEDFFQRLVTCTIYSKIQFAIKTNNNKTIGELFPFLKTCFISSDTLKHVSTSCGEKVDNFLRENSEAHYMLWERILDSFSNNEFVVPALKSFFNNSMIWIDKVSQKLLAICCKNGPISCSILKQEIEIVDRMRIGKYKNMKICFVVVALEYDATLTNNLDLSTNNYVTITGQAPLQVKSINTVDTVTCDKNTQVILVNQNGFIDFLSKDTLEYLYFYKKAKETGDSFLATAFALLQ